MPDAQLKVGDQAPDFELMNQDRNNVRLSDYRGKRKVMLLFYPMDFSPVCTEEHCTFGPPLNEKMKDADTVVFGINADHPFSHAEFRRKYDIPYDLLSDPTRKTLKAYGMRSSMSRRGDCWDTQFRIRLERRTDLTRVGIGRAALALTCRSGSGVPRALPGSPSVT